MRLPATDAAGPWMSAGVEFLGIDLLEEHARRLAAYLTIARESRGKPRAHLRQLDERMRTLRTVYSALAEDIRSIEVTSPAAEWLLDNFHVIAGASRDVRHDLPASFHRRLPQVASDEFAGLPRISVLAFELIRTSAGRLDAQRLQRFIAAYQSVTPLTIGELWAWPSALKLALIEHLRVRAEVLYASVINRRLADRLAAAHEKGIPETQPWPPDVHPSFVTRLMQRAQDDGMLGRMLRPQLDAALASRGQSVEDAIAAEGRHQAAEQAAMAGLISSLRLISTFDWRTFFETVSLVEQVLQRDPAGVYARMDFATRDRYRHAVEELADPTGEAQLRVARTSVERARRVGERTPDARGAHVGYHLIGAGRKEFERSVAWVPNTGQRIRRLLFRWATPGYLGTLALGTALLSGVAVAYAASWGWSSGALFLVLLLTIVPASEATIQIVQRVISYLIPPRRLPRFELDWIPDNARTMVIVPTILESVERVRELIDHIEVQAAGNTDPNLHFAILSDWGDATTETQPADAAILETAREGIETLNAKHGGPTSRFFLFHRARHWNEQQGLWMGWERKRGKIEEFNRLLRGATDTSFVFHVGDMLVLPQVRYCITLDSDTRLPRDAARELVGVITHPLNRPTLDPQVGRVTEGYGILQPRVSVTFLSAAGSLFARLYAGHTGVDPYTTAVSDTYQDLFGEGIFTGKGLYDVDAFMASLADTVPENALLSHDLFEGIHARAALVSDVELVDDYPSSVLTHARRQHRWIRGDWQILLWLFPFVPTRQGLKRNTLPLISRWKILDNLRRSLVPPMLLAMLVAGWTVLPGTPWFWTIAALGVIASQLLPLIARFVAGPRRLQSKAVFLRNLLHDTATTLAQILLGATFLVYHAFDSAHAIGLTLVRLVFTKRRLLEWETAAATARRLIGLNGQSGLRRFAGEMVASPVVAGLALVTVALRQPVALAAAAPFLMLWTVAPFIGYWLSVPVGPRVRPLGDAQRRILRRTARKTWRYFETFATEADGWLPPDNYQEVDARVARRTSPTNIAMGLLSTMAAHDLGFLSTPELVERLDAMLTTLEGLERHEGHFLNWYDTATRAPLHPRYVSTVDSGNLAAALGALAQGLLQLAETPQTRAQLLAGLSDTADLLAIATARSHGGESREAVTRINALAREIASRTRHGGRELDEARLDSLASRLDDAAAAASATDTGDAGDTAFWSRAVLRGLGALRAQAQLPDTGLQALAGRAAALADGIHFGFLYDHHRRIFAIGYRLADAEGPGRLDAAYYDLLASEARLASFVAIAKNDVPQHHWFHLGRPVTNVGGRATLMSWGGTLFEYLMPMLLMRTFPETLLDQSCGASVLRQIQYGHEHRVPWGVSESAYAFTDREGNYQYRAFGVPGLGLKRGLSDDLVVAPYATALASLVDPAAAIENFEGLANMGLDGRFGFYEAIDFRPRNRDIDAPPEGNPRPAIVRAYFAHHQGMSLVAFANVICEDAFVKRFHADPRVQATELLLQERVPREAVLLEPRPIESRAAAFEIPTPASRRFRSPHTTSLHSHVLSNGRYTTMLTHVGGGSSTWRDLAVTRPTEDWVTDAGPHYLYLRDPWSGRVWSATYLPLGGEPDSYEVVFDIDKATYRRRDGDLETLVQIAVSSEDDVEVRRLSITNRGDRPREIEVTSYAEIVLARPADDLAHPAFSKLFVETEFDPQSAGLLFTRRPRAADEAPVWAFHVLGVEKRVAGAVEWETDRARFLGRGRSADRPQALDGRALSGTVGAVLDPVAALRERVRLPPGAFVRVSFATGIASDRAAALTLARKYRDGNAAARAFSMAFTHAHTTIRHLGLSEEQAILFDRLASRVFGADRSCISPIDLAANTLGQGNLWGYGISGDLPMVLVRIAEVESIALVRQLLRAQEYWRVNGLRTDVIILNEHPADYLDETQQALTRLVQEPRWASWLDKAGGLFLLRADGMPEADRRLLAAVARVVLEGDRGELAAQLHRTTPWLFTEHDVHPAAQLTRPATAAMPMPVPELLMANGLGGFTEGGREYVIVLDGDRDTPLPWSNVLASPDFGTIVTASGSSFTWAGNSRENRLTPFANDPVVDPTGEAIFLRDEDTGAVWGATPGPLPRRPTGGRWLVRHGAGVTRYQHAVAGLEHELSIAVSPDDPVKVALLTLTNTSDSTRHLSVFGYVEWVLGPPRAGGRQFIVTEPDEATGAILARNTYNTEFSDHVAFWQASERPQYYTCDRAEFIGRNRTISRPAALFRPALLGRHGAGLDPCGALQISLSIEPGSSQRLAFCLGQGRSMDHARELARRYGSLSQAAAAPVAARGTWDDLLGAVRVKTPDDSFDLIVNRWLPYQALCCRVWARSGPYQPGGAFGFRDQLQDVLALTYTRPDLCRAHLLQAASRQFVEGDVQHWWHPPSGRGTRTRCSDDLVWLPYALVTYLARTGDESVLDEVVPFLEGPPVEEGESDNYMLPRVSSESGSLFEHAIRAVTHAMRYGAHGLPLIGSGDWNDGMNRVGHAGKGESVWLGWFLVYVLNELAPICQRRGLVDLADRYRNEARYLTGMLELAWDGDWYRRAYFDDGTPLGSVQNDECRIDSLTQSWAVLSRAAESSRAEGAMEAVRAQLVRRDAGLVLLLTPPFDRTAKDPGYIKGYLPGIRENGGQYTHAAIWTVIALARLSLGNQAMELFHMLNPINHTRTAEGVERYRVEPYVVAADVYAHPMHLGRGGWTWYTGAAGWMYQAALDALLGLRRQGHSFSVNPCIPGTWPAFSVEWSVDGTSYRVNVTNPHHQCCGVQSAALDGVEVDPQAIPMRSDGGHHEVAIVLGRGTARRTPAREAQGVSL